MLIISREQSESRATCIIELEKDEEYNQDLMLDACSPRGLPRYSSCLGYIPEHEGRYRVTVQTGHEPYDDIFAKMVKEYGKA